MPPRKGWVSQVFEDIQAEAEGSEIMGPTQGRIEWGLRNAGALSRWGPCVSNMWTGTPESRGESPGCLPGQGDAGG